MTRRFAALVILTLALCGCGGGGSGEGEAPSTHGSRESTSIHSRITGTTYSLSIYLPPASAGPREHLPVVYALDGDTWFTTLAGIAESAGQPIIVVAIDSAGQRNRDFVPANDCTPNGGGQARYFDFIRQELLPFVEAGIGGDPAQRILFGHSHGGNFVLYALFSEAPGQHGFRSYLASDASISCMPATAKAWERTYASAHRELPVRLHLSYATQGNFAPNLEYAGIIAQRDYEGLAFQARAYTGTHGGIVPRALADGIGFALAAP